MMKSLVCVLIISSCCLISCSKQSQKFTPNAISDSTTCRLCGMVIMNYPGPHSQIVFKDGHHDFYCDLFEVMPLILRKAERERMGKIYVQAFDDKKWGSYHTDWLAADKAYYVIDSRKTNAMGISYVPFKSKQQANSFQKQYGGEIRKFSQLTNAVVKHSYQLMRTKPKLYGPHMTMMPGH